jgi:hypothetical protein
MGKDSGTPGGAGGTPAVQAPPLPADVPKDIRDFVECRTTTLSLANGKLDWVTGLPGGIKPEMTIVPGDEPGTATIQLKVAGIPLSLPASITDGVLAIDGTGIAMLDADIAARLQAFVSNLNRWLAANGKGFGAPTFQDGTIGLSKVALEPPYYEPTYVQQPPLPKGELFPPGGVVTPPPPPTPVAPAEIKTGFRPIVGAGGPGGPKAPAGLGSLGVRAIVATIVAAILLGAGFIAFGGFGQPAAQVQPTATPGIATAGLPTGSPVPVATVAVSAGVPLFTAPFDITGDRKISSCEHVYDVVFRVVDMTGNGAAFEGRTAVYRLLNGEPERTRVIGAGGLLADTVDEQFTKTGAGCYSQLNPTMLTVDGQAPAY